MNLKEIVTDWLRTHGYDGLYTDACGCEINDLFPCGGPFDDCESGYRVLCQCSDGHDFHIAGKKQEVELENMEAKVTGS